MDDLWISALELAKTYHTSPKEIMESWTLTEFLEAYAVVDFNGKYANALRHLNKE